MRQETTNVVPSQLGKACIAIAEEQGLLVLPKALMNMHTGTVIAEHWLGHESNGFAMFAGRVLGDIFVEHNVIRAFRQRAIAHVDLSLSWAAYFMVVCFNWHAECFEQEDHLTAYVLERIIGG